MYVLRNHVSRSLIQDQMGHLSTALREHGVSYRTSGENIAYGQRTPQEVVNAWMNSPGHSQHSKS